MAIRRNSLPSAILRASVCLCLVALAMPEVSKHKRSELQTEEARPVPITDLIQKVPKLKRSDVHKARPGTRVALNVEKTLVPYARGKRGWGSVLFTGGTLLLRGTSLGLNLATAITEGCALFKSICRDKDAIEKLEAKITQKQTEYDNEYRRSSVEFISIRKAYTKNSYISYYINETMQKLHNVTDLENQIMDELELKAEKLSSIVAQNLSSRQYLDGTIGRLEHTLSDLEKMLSDKKRDQLIGLAIQFVVEAVLGKFITAYKKAYSQVLDAEGILGTSSLSELFSADLTDDGFVTNPNHPRAGAAGKADKLKFSKKFKLTGKVFKQMGKNFIKRFKSIKNGVKKWTRVLGNWKGFKGKLKHTFKGPLTKLSNIKKFISSSPFRKTTFRSFKNKMSAKIKQYKIGVSDVVMSVVGVAADIASHVISAMQWKKMADDFAKARKQYEQSLRRIIDELDELKVERRKLEKEWPKILDSFKTLTKSYKGLVKNATANADFAIVMGFPKLPVSMGDPIMTLNFDKLNKTSLPAAQDAVQEFLRQNDIGMNSILERMKARITLYSTVRARVKQEDTVSSIFTFLSGIFNFNSPGTVGRFEHTLKKKDIVCTIAIMFQQSDEYDYYPLAPFRPHCNVSNSSFKVFDQDAKNQRNEEMLRKVVEKKIKKDPTLSLSDLLESVRAPYILSKDKSLVRYGNSLNEQDIVCSVASQFPQMTDYDFISLQPFRPDCSSVSSSQFSNMTKDAERLSALVGQVKSSMNICEMWKFCPCVPMLAKQYQAPEADVRKAIKYVRPSLTHYCGTTDCPCVRIP